MKLKILIIPYIMKKWGKTNFEIAEILRKYKVLPYIDTSYELYNTLGINGIILDLEEFIRCQGGK